MSAHCDVIGKYKLEQTIGTGGFGKVKLATHILTGEQVAIKIMIKEKLGEDLRRVQAEIDALKDLCHQNIARLYEVIETEDKYLLVLEYCRQGELFDYIVKKDRLPEAEARHFFRQIVSAIAFVHHKGYAHRDLKPENILLTTDLQVKLIDFGLCAKPSGGITVNPLSTCCGSPAYAAPELISGQPYFGGEADIWSLGILLYALLCGFLPFDDEKLSVMYAKIVNGVYEKPSWLSDQSCSILKDLLCTSPDRRIKVEQLLVHPWVTLDYVTPVKWRSVFDPAQIDEEICQILSRHGGLPFEKLAKKILEWHYDYITATYLLLLNAKQRLKYIPVLTKPTIAPPKLLHPPADLWDSPMNILKSPTIHASLESNLDRIDEIDLDICDPVIDDFQIPKLRLDAQKQQQNEPSALRNIENITNNYVTPISQKHQSRTHKSRQSERKNSKQNENWRPNSMQENGSALPPIPKGPIPRTPWNVYHTPSLQTARDSVATPSLSNRATVERPPIHSSGKYDKVDDDTPGLFLPVEDETVGRTPRSRKRREPIGTKTRMFSSLERGFDRIKTAMTPKRKIGSISGPPTVKEFANVSTTSSSDPEKVLSELLRVFREQGIECETPSRWTVKGRKYDRFGQKLQIEFQIVYVDQVGLIGVKRKRLQGDSMMYKKICEDILKLADIA